MVTEARTRDPAPVPLAKWTAPYQQRLERALAAALPRDGNAPPHLQQVMRQAVVGTGTPAHALLVYATGEALSVSPDMLDAPAVAVQLMHAFALMHDAVGTGDRRRGDEAISILAADALQPLAFQVLATAPALQAHPDAQMRMVALLAEGCGANGLVGGRALCLAVDGKPDPAELEHAYRLATGRLLRAGVLCAALCAPGISLERWHALERFVDAVGVASQIHCDILGTAEAGLARHRVPYPQIFGAERAQSRTAALADAALAAIAKFGPAAEPLRRMADYLALGKE